MLKEAEHFEKVKRVRVAEKDVAPLLPAYEVRRLVQIVLVWDSTDFLPTSLR